MENKISRSKDPEYRKFNNLASRRQNFKMASVLRWVKLKHSSVYLAIEKEAWRRFPGKYGPEKHEERQDYSFVDKI